jgi:hypothetical protein
VTNFSNWPEWLKLLVLVPNGILASVMCWLCWPKSEKEWRKFGFLVAYLIVFFVVMRFVFQMKDFERCRETLAARPVGECNQDFS